VETTNHRPRPVTHYGVELINGWPTKLHGLAVEGEPEQELVAAARRIAAATLPGTGQVGAASDGATSDGLRAAFVIAHQARPACFVLVYWWSGAVDLSLAYFRSPLDRPTALAPMPAFATGCVWELALAAHERAAWVRHLLTGEPDLDAYLGEVPPAEVS
jgi:hypothetical protein